MGTEWIKRLEIEIKMTPQERIERAGRLAERRVNRILAEMKKEKEFKDYQWHERWSKDDLRGIDFTIFPFEGPPIYLQVKSYLFPSLVKQLKLKEIRPGIWQRGRIYNIEAGERRNRLKIKEKISKILEINGEK